MLIVTSSRNQYSANNVSLGKLTIDFVLHGVTSDAQIHIFTYTLYRLLGRLLHGGDFGRSNKMFTHNLCSQWESGKSWQRACSACQLRGFVKKNIIYILYTHYFFNLENFPKSLLLQG